MLEGRGPAVERGERLLLAREERAQAAAGLVDVRTKCRHALVVSGRQLSVSASVSAIVSSRAAKPSSSSATLAPARAASSSARSRATACAERAASER